MTLSELKTRLEETDQELIRATTDDMVVDEMLAQASSINNSCINDIVDFLLESGYQIKELVEKLESTGVLNA